jgi:prepilin-type N-terminal cleavage/methylation domain-containing protein
MICAPFTGMETGTTLRIPRQAPFSYGGYSLIELLTVITIVAVLATLMVAVVNGVKESARRVHAKSDLVHIVAAIKAYRTEYGVYPVKPDQAGSEVTFAIDNSDLFNTLRAIPEGANDQRQLNPRGITYLEVPPAPDPIKPRNGIAHGCWYDPWGPQSDKPESGVYHVRIDTADTNRVTNPYPGGDPDEGEATIGPKLNLSVISWSLGKGGVQTYELRDQVISWN